MSLKLKRNEAKLAENIIINFKIYRQNLIIYSEKSIGVLELYSFFEIYSLKVTKVALDLAD